MVMQHGAVLKNIRIKGRRTSVRMELPFWEALESISKEEGRSIDDICEEVSSQKAGSSLTSAIRVFVLDYVRRMPVLAGGRAAIQ